MKKKLYGKVKYLSLLLAVTVFVMGFSMFTVIGETQARIYGGDETTTAGSVVTLPLSIENNPGIAAFTLELSYDKNVLDFVSLTSSADGEFADTEWLLEKNGDVFLWSNDTLDDYHRIPYNTESDGIMLDLVFKVADDAQPGVYPVEIGLKDGEAANVSDCNGEPVEVAFDAGVIRVEDNSGAVTVKNVTLFKPADKLNYFTGEDFDITGAQLLVEWDNGDTTYVDVTEQMLEAIPDTSSAGTKTVKVEYLGWEDKNDLTFEITVTDPEVKDVTLFKPADKLEYWTGEAFDVTGAKLKLEWTNGDITYIDVTEQMLESVPDMSTAGTKTVQVEYLGFELINDLTFDIEVKPVVITNVTLFKTADKLTYWTDEKFDITGAQLKVEWSNGDVTYVDVTEQMLESVPDTTTAGTKTVQVVYEGWEDKNDLTFKITVKAPSVVNAELNPAPTKKEYKVGDEFDATGGKIKIEYDHGEPTYVDVTKDMCSGYDMSTPGEYEVTVSYGDYEFTYVIKVVPEVNPPSGDNTSWMLPVMALILSVAVAGVSVYLKKRKAED